MCGHFAIGAATLKQLIERYAIERCISLDPDQDIEKKGFYPSRGATTTLVPVVVALDGARSLELQRWDMVPSWWKKPLSEKRFSSYNARSDSLLEKATFKGAWACSRRCIIPATMFFEWPDKDLLPDGAKRTEHTLALTDQVVFSMAGIWDECTAGEHKGLRSCAIITTSANNLLESIPHSRMPVILLMENEAAWIDSAIGPDDAMGMLGRYPEAQMRIIK